MSESDQGASPRAARTAGRELALQLLYAFEQNRYKDDGYLLTSDCKDGLDPTSVQFAAELYQGFIAERIAVDAAVDKRLENWTLIRLAVCDRNLLRLGAYELLYRDDTPAKVAINEYIEMAKKFGSDGKTTKLVNGVLDRIARDHRTAEIAKK